MVGVTVPPEQLASPSPPEMPHGGHARRSLRWAAVIVTAWALVLAGFWWWGVRTATPTAREQTTVAQARPFVDEAVARVAMAAAADPGAVVAIGPFEPVGECDVSVFRSGERYRRSVVAVVPPGTEASLLRRVAADLPAAYAAATGGSENPRLYADAGLFVRLTGTVTAAGEVTFHADTGECREAGELATSDPATPAPATMASAVARALELSGGESTDAAVSCVDGGVAGTVTLRAPAFAGDLSVALAEVDGDVVVATEGLFAFRTGDADVAVRAHDDATIITVTTLCP
jgi:hypothetical protein